MMRLSTTCPLRVQRSNQAKSTVYEVKWRTIQIFLQDASQKFLCIRRVFEKTFGEPCVLPLARAPSPRRPA
jgi:hypothetical protein